MMTEEDISTEFTSKDDQIEKDQRRLSLLTDPNYGIILCFLDKFRSSLDLPNYSFQRLEDHLVNYRERIPPRLIDFHFILLKRLSLAKNTQREKFDSIITKFAFRFDLNDGDHLTTAGYLQADMHVKIRILKNLLESQFDLNQTFTKTLIDKSAREIKSTPLGRDRFGVSYWLFMDTDCFVRLFREDVDLERTWSNVAKDRDELEKFIKLLITDAVVRKKFSDWIIDYEPFSSLIPSNEFEEYYLPPIVDVKEEAEEEVETIKKKRGRPKSSISNETAVEIKQEPEEEIDRTLNDDEKLDIAIKRKRGRPKGSIVLFKKETKEIDMAIKPEVGIEATLNDDEKFNEPIKKKRGRPKGSIKSLTKEKTQLDIERKPGRPKSSIKQLNMEIKEEEITPSRRGRKRKILMEENNDDEADKQQDESSIRRSSRPRKAPSMEPTSVVPSKTIVQIPSVKKKRSINGKTKVSDDLSTTNTKSARSRRRRKTTTRRNLNDDFCLSSSSSDEHIAYPSEDEYDSDDYLPNPSQIEHDENFFELDEDNNPLGEELRTAKTAQASTIITACQVCSKSDRPEVLLLCDDCDDAYHLECLRPILLSVPDGDWYCPLCEHQKLSNHLIEKLKELLINFNLLETKRLEHDLKKSLQRKIQRKEYTSDESITASESEDENLENNLHGDESMLSISQTNENSNISSSYLDDSTKNISQRGRHRRTRFDMNKMLNNDGESDDGSNTDRDDEYMENTAQITNFDLQIPKKMTRLLNYRYRPIARNDQRLKPKPIAPRVSQLQSSEQSEYRADYNTNEVCDDQQQIKRIQKTNFSPYLTKVAFRPLPILLPKPTGIGYKIFKSKDPPTSTAADLSNIILTPSSSSSLLDANDEQSTSTMHS